MSEWIKWNGGECPVHPDTVVEYEMKAGMGCKIGAGWLYWDHKKRSGDIIAYKIIQAYQPTIAETIRDAAINWPQFLGDVESNILHAFGPLTFCGEGGFNEYLWGTKEDQLQARTFMLLVAEALQ